MSGQKSSYKLPLLEPDQPTYHIHDASKLQTFMRCQRKYFFNYVLGWEHITPSIHLIFGEAWHRAMETVLLLGMEDQKDTIAAAYVSFEKYYREFFGEMTDQEKFPKNPAMALKALVEYVRTYHKDRFEPIFTEVAGSVPIDEQAFCRACKKTGNWHTSTNMCLYCGAVNDFDITTRTLHFRLDSIVRDEQGRISSIEHKTGSTNSQAWRDGWLLKTQIGLYMHTLFCLESFFKLKDPEARIHSVIVNGVFFKKGRQRGGEYQGDVEPLRMVIKKPREMMRVFLWNTIYWLDEIERQFRQLERCTPDQSVLFAFPMNTEACTDFGGCPYHDFCLSWPNPLKRQDELPHDMQVRWWNPADREKEARVVLKNGIIQEKSSDSI